MTTPVANLIADMQRTLVDLQTRVAQLEAPLDIQAKALRIAELDDRMSAPGFWDAPEKAQSVQKERTNLDAQVKSFEAAKKGINDLLELLEMAGDDEATLNDLVVDVDKVDASAEGQPLRRRRAALSMPTAS